MVHRTRDQKPRAWRPRPGGMPKPSLRDTMQPGYVAQTADEASADELDRWARWRRATPDERARALAGLLELVEAMGRFPPKRDRFPGWKTIVAQRDAKTTVR
jgi:hypothetical protein